MTNALPGSVIEFSLMARNPDVPELLIGFHLPAETLEEAMTLQLLFTGGYQALQVFVPDPPHGGHYLFAYGQNYVNRPPILSSITAPSLDVALAHLEHLVHNGKITAIEVLQE